MSKTIKVGLSDHNEHEKTLFCIRTYEDGAPLSKKYKEDFNEAMDLAKELADGEPQNITVNVRAYRYAKTLALRNLKESKASAHTA